MESTELLRHVANIIRTEPESFDMSDWLFTPGGDYAISVSEILSLGASHPVGCGTTACIAGHAILAAPDQAASLAWLHDDDIETVGGKLLGLHQGAAARLFWLKDVDDVDLARLLDQLADIDPHERESFHGPSVDLILWASQ